MKSILFFLVPLSYAITSNAQTNPLYDRLPLGNYVVGFKIVRITDSSRVTKPLYNYFGERENGDRTRKITLHVWYPAEKKAGSTPLSLADYCASEALESTSKKMSIAEKEHEIHKTKDNITHFYGAFNENDWTSALQSKMLALKGPRPIHQEFPLLIGMLRPFSTTITNEVLASNGFVVAMVMADGERWPRGFITNVADMQHAISYLTKTFRVYPDSIGTFGFSGSGFSQLLLAMNDPRIAAYADIESALYGEGVADLLLSSNYYDRNKLHIPFLHIYGKELARSDVKFDDFLQTKYSERYHLLLNYTRLHHWDVATEGRISSTLLHMRGEDEAFVRSSFELCNLYLLHFFNATLKQLEDSKKILADRTNINQYADSLWTIRHYDGLKQPPDRNQFAAFIQRKGIMEGLALARSFQKQDSSSPFIHENDLNALAQDLMENNKAEDAILLMQLAIEFHPGQAWLWRNLAGMQEDSGKIDDAINSFAKAIDILKDFTVEPSSFEGRVKRSAEESLQRLKAAKK